MQIDHLLGKLGYEHRTGSLKGQIVTSSLFLQYIFFLRSGPYNDHLIIRVSDPTFFWISSGGGGGGGCVGRVGSDALIGASQKLGSCGPFLLQDEGHAPGAARWGDGSV